MSDDRQECPAQLVLAEHLRICRHCSGAHRCAEGARIEAGAAPEAVQQAPAPTEQTPEQARRERDDAWCAHYAKALAPRPAPAAPPVEQGEARRSWLRVLLGVPAAERVQAVTEDPSLLDAALREADRMMDCTGVPCGHCLTCLDGERLHWRQEAERMQEVEQGEATPVEAPGAEQGWRSPMLKRAADALADEVAALVRRRVIDSRSPAADALLDYRDPPTTPRADRLAVLEAERDAATARAEQAERRVQTFQHGERQALKMAGEAEARVRDLEGAARRVVLGFREHNYNCAWLAAWAMLDVLERIHLATPATPVTTKGDE